MLRTRVLTAAFLVPIVLVVIFLGEPLLSIMVGALVFLGLTELINLLDAAGYQPPQVMTKLGGRSLTCWSTHFISRGAPSPTKIMSQPELVSRSSTGDQSSW